MNRISDQIEQRGLKFKKLEVLHELKKHTYIAEQQCRLLIIQNSF